MILAVVCAALGCSSASGDDLFGDGDGADDAGSSGGEAIAGNGGAASGGASSGGAAAASGGVSTSGGAVSAGGAQSDACKPGDWRECSGDAGCDGIQLCRWETYAECVCQPGSGGGIGSGGALVGGTANGGAASGGSGSGGATQVPCPDDCIIDNRGYCDLTGACKRCGIYTLDCVSSGERRRWREYGCSTDIQQGNCGGCGVSCGFQYVCEPDGAGSASCVPY